MIEKLNEKLLILKNEFFVIEQLMQRDKKRNTSSTFAGELWEIINPLINMIMMVLVFKNMFGNATDKQLPLYVLTGTTIYGFFTAGTTSSLNALSGNKSFLIKTQIKKTIYVLEKILFALKNFMYSIIIYAFVVAIYRMEPSIVWLCIIPDILLLVVMMYGMGKLLATINVSFADITYLYKIFTLMVMYGSALFYRTERLSPYVQAVMKVNPVYSSIAIARISIMDGAYPPIRMWVTLAIYAICCYMLGTYVFNREANNIVAKL